MNFKQILHELQDIPIKDYKTDTAGQNFEKVTKPPQEADKGQFRFNINDYTLKKGKLSASTADELETKLDAFLEKSKDRMSTVYNYSGDGLSAFIVYYDKNVSNLDGKYKTALSNKIETFAKAHSKEPTRTNFGTNSAPQTTSVLNNIQKVIATLSDRSKKDLEKYVRLLQSRDKQAGNIPPK